MVFIQTFLQLHVVLLLFCRSYKSMKLYDSSRRYMPRRSRYDYSDGYVDAYFRHPRQSSHHRGVCNDYNGYDVDISMCDPNLSYDVNQPNAYHNGGYYNDGSQYYSDQQMPYHWVLCDPSFLFNSLPFIHTHLFSTLLYFK